MSREKMTKHFGHAGPYFLPVIHVENKKAELSLRRSVDAGADGAFLISHSMGHRAFVEYAKVLADEFHDHLWLGINCLGLPSYGVREAIPSDHIRGIWADNGNIYENGPTPAAAMTTESLRGWNGLYFGGTAFKTQRRVDTNLLRDLATLAAVNMDVVCTSGPGTGSPPNVEKIRLLREGCGNHPLAIASGIDPENVGPFLPLADAFLVATGISESFDLLDAAKTKELAALIRAARKAG